MVSLCVSPGFKLSLHTSFSFWIPALPGLREVHCTAPSCMGTTMNINRWAPQGITAHTCLAAGWECQYLHNTGIVISPVFADFSSAIWFILTPRYTIVRVKNVTNLYTNPPLMNNVEIMVLYYWKRMMCCVTATWDIPMRYCLSQITDLNLLFKQITRFFLVWRCPFDNQSKPPPEKGKSLLAATAQLSEYAAWNVDLAKLSKRTCYCLQVV